MSPFILILFLNNKSAQDQLIYNGHIVINNKKNKKVQVRTGK